MALRDSVEPVLPDPVVADLARPARALDELSGRLGHIFKNRHLLQLALTHGSSKAKREDYQRLEFLGDRVLALIIAEQLFRESPEHREGDLSSRHSHLVRGDACASVGRALGLGEFISVGSSERRQGVNLSASILGDVVEALIAAIYLDGGLEAARTFVLRNWQPLIAEYRSAEKDAKTFLQEWALARGLALPVYAVVGRKGPEHAPLFTVSLEIEGMAPARGEGLSKRLAEKAAADSFIKREGLRA